jgi:hypothetical protein
MSYYTNTKACIINNGFMSDEFVTTIGVKQGGSLSPRLFSLYIEEIIDELDSLNCGYKLKSININTLLYADDIILISNTKTDLQKMLRTVSIIGVKLQIKFNPDKTNYISINDNLNLKTRRYLYDANNILSMDGLELKRVKSFKYLGNMISDDTKNILHVDARINKAISIEQKIERLGYVRKGTPETLAQLHKTYVRPILYYGLDVLYLTKKDKYRIKKHETTNIKLALGLSPRLKTKPLMYALGIDHQSNLK